MHTNRRKSRPNISRSNSRNQSSGSKPKSPNRIQNQTKGNPQQSHAKYVALAKVAMSSGDRVDAESYFQYAEHFYRVIAASGQPPTSPQSLQTPNLST